MKTGSNTSTIIHRTSLSKSNGKYKLNKSEKSLIKERNNRIRMMRKCKTKCLKCRHLKDAEFCLRNECYIKPEEFEGLTECKYFSKL